MRPSHRLDAYGLSMIALLVGCGGNAATPAGTQGPGSSDGTQVGVPGQPQLGPGASSGQAGAAAPGTTPGSTGTNPGRPAVAPPTGTSDFVSADTSTPSKSAGRELNGGLNAAAGAPTPSTAPTAAAGDASTASPRAVERGDIYRVLPDQRILNLNSYRGVQIIDTHDASAPRVEGRLAVAGQPVELYVVGDQAIVLINGWQGYYGERDDVKVQSVQGGLIMSVDISDRAHPMLIDQATIAGNIATSRLTQGSGQVALYVASTNYNEKAEAIVKSFELQAGKLAPKSELNLGGSVQDIQATTDVLMVISQDYTKQDQRSQVSVVDISSPDGTMVKGGSVTAAGMVQNKFNTDAYKGVLRVVSGASWSGTTENHVETFDLRDLNKLTPLDHCTFGTSNLQPGQNDMLFATLFVENKAFFVTYYRRDPFHAFSIDDQGKCVEHAEFLVSGWNDFLRATLQNTRLIGIGRNDENNTSKLSVSLYDAENLANPSPLAARADVELNQSYSEASWDDRGFSVLEDATSATASDGTKETGLVLLPFQGWDATTQKSVAHVQIFTFSNHTLTKRGEMDHGSPVRRSFEARDALTANLSDEQLSLFDTANPDAPKELGRVDVAPSYDQLFVFGDYVARVKSDGSYSIRDPNAMQPSKLVQIIARSGDVDGTAVLTSFEVPGGASLTQVGNLLVSVVSKVAAANSGNAPATYHSTINVFDLSDAEHPRPRGTLETDRIQPSYGGIYPLAGKGGPQIADCFDCGGIYPRGGGTQSYVLGASIAFVHTDSQQKSLGQVHECYQYAPGVACSSDSSGNTSCPSSSYYSGGITCTTPAGGKEQCSGEFYLCDGTGNCTPTATTPPGVMSNCNDYEQFRYWTSYAFDTLDLHDPDNLAIAPRLAMAKDQEGTSLVASGTTLYFNYQQPFMMKDDPRSYVKHFVRLLDFATPTSPSAGDPINIPGEVIAASDTTLYTRDFVWNDNDARTLVARLTLDGKLAHLQASQLFADRNVSAVQSDGAGHLLVSSDPVFSGPVVAKVATAAEAPKHTLSILDASSLDTIGEADVDAWATFKDAKQGRALFQVSGGLLVFDVRDAAKPVAQAYFPTQGWPDAIYFDGQDIMFAAGPYGVYRFDASAFNLMTH